MAEQVLAGLPASPGEALGRAWLLVAPPAGGPPLPASARPAALAAARAALVAAGAELGALAERLRAAGRAVGEAPVLDGPALATALDAALGGVVELGAAEPGDKTMVDALGPAARTLRERVEAGEPLPEALEAAVAAAEEGARATIPMQARKGRASCLGERSIGHQDPGATSTVLIVAALGRALDPGR